MPECVVVGVHGRGFHELPRFRRQTQVYSDVVGRQKAGPNPAAEAKIILGMLGGKRALRGSRIGGFRGSEVRLSPLLKYSLRMRMSAPQVNGTVRFFTSFAHWSKDDRCRRSGGGRHVRSYRGGRGGWSLSQGGRRSQHGKTQRQFQFGVQHKIRISGLINNRRLDFDFFASATVPESRRRAGCNCRLQFAEFGLELETIPGLSSLHKPILQEIGDLMEIIQVHNSREKDCHNCGKTGF